MRKSFVILAITYCISNLSFAWVDNVSNNLMPSSPCTAMVCDGNALNFDGEDDYIEMSNFIVPTSGDFTVEFWINSSSISTFKEFISQGSAGDAFYIGTFSGSTEIRCGDMWQSTGVNLPLNQWVHVAMTKSGLGASLFINGVLVATTSSYSISSGGTFTRLGRQYDGYAEYPVATMDELRIWNAARTPEQIFNNMNYELSVQAGLIGSYHFSEGIAGNDNSAIPQILDNSGNAHHGTLINFAKTGATSNWVGGISFEGLLYQDGDNDGYGNPDVPELACNAPSGYVLDNSDCNDANNTINPEATEVCNGVDDDCNGIVDEMVPSGVNLFLPMSGNTYDKSGYTHNATGFNAALTTDRTGVASSAYDFNGTNARIEVVDHPDLRPTSLTLSIWVYYSAVPGGLQHLISKPLCGGWADSYGMWINGGSIYFGWGTGPYSMEYYSFPAPSAGQWHQFVLTFDDPGDQARFYIDNVLKGTYTTWSTVVYDNTPLIMGAEYENCGLTFWFDGKLDEVMLFNRALSASEVADLYQSPYLPNTYYQDADMDGFGNPDSTQISCTGVPEGYVDNNYDCHDAGNTIYPDAIEVCNGMDDDCDGEIDEAGYALHFDGVNDNIFLPTTGYQTTASYTIECWLNTSSAAFMMIWEGQDPLLSNPSLEGMADNLEFWINNSSMVSTGPIATGQWNHIACVYNSATQLQSIFVNGDLKESATVSTVTDFGNTLYLGSRLGIENFYGGLMDEVRIWTVARTQAEIAANMALPIDPALEPSLAAYYRFDQGTGEGDNTEFTVAHDYSGNGNEAMLNNFAMTGTTSNYVSPTPMPGADIYYADSDNDGFGDPVMPQVSCTGVPSGYVLDDSDCNDASDLVHPGATEVCNGMDDDCDGITDEGFINVEESLHFDGSNDYINVGNWWNNQQFTVQMWLKPGSSQATYTDIIDNNHFGGVRWVCQQNGGITNEYAFGVATTGGVAGVAFTLAPSVWQHLTLVKGASSIEVYVNGNLIGSSPCSGNIVGGGVGQDNIFIGNWNSGGRNWHGTMDEIRLWNYGLTQAQIQEDLYCELTGTESGLVAYYKLNQGTAGGNNSGITTAIDASGNAHHGGLVGFNLTGSTSNFVTGAENLGNCGVLYADNDGDGYGNPAVTIEASCGVPGYVANNDDCDDEQNTINPNGGELCNGVDDDCDGEIDEAGHALHFDGVNDNIFLPTAGYQTSSSYTIECWLNTSSPEFIMIWEGADPLFSNPSLEGMADNLEFWINNSSMVSTGPISIGQWNHIACVYNNATQLQSIFVNGILKASATVSTVTDFGNTLYLGSRLGSNTFYGGLMDEVRIWTVARTQEEIVDNMSSHIDPDLEPSLAAYYRFDQGNGEGDNSEFTVAHDYSGNGNEALLNNFAMTGSTSNFVSPTPMPGTFTYYADADNDGYGNPSVTALGCTAPAGFISDHADCNDANQTINPGAPEECNGMDDNCNGVVDEGFEYSVEATFISSSSGNTFCAGGSTILSFNGGSLGTDAEWVWYEGGCGSGASIGTGNELEVTPSGGAHTYYVRAEGTCNSTACASILINVNYAPSFTTCPADFSIGNNPEECNATSSYVAVASGSPAPALSYTLSGATTGSGSGTGNGTVLDMGTTLVTIMADNLCGSSECSFDITVNDIEDPIIFECPSTIESQVDTGQWGAMVTWTEPGAIDNCAMGTLTSSHSPGDFFNVGSTVVTYTAMDESGNSSMCTFIVTVEPPEILGDVNLSIFANDIQFSNTNPPPGTFINVNATVHNTSNEDASSFVCHLVDQYSNISYPDVNVPVLLANQSTIVSWVIETPAVPAFVPMQVTIDYLDSQDESNELDNQAIRPFINGEFDFGGQIVVTSSAVPSSTVAGNYISICGNAYYDETAIPLEDSSVAGAQVTIIITETGQVLSGVTNAAGDFCISYLTPNTSGTYHYTASVTDFTLTGDTSGTFILTPPPVEYCPKDLSVGVELFGSFLCGNIYHIVQGSSLTGVVHVSNSCQSSTTETTLYIALPDGTPVPGPFVIPSLTPGQTYDVPLPAMTFNSVGATYISATVDYLNAVAEDVESNNTRNITLYVHPPLPDITSVHGQAYPNFQCTPSTITFRIENQGGVPTGSFVALLDVFQGATLETSLTQTVSSIDGLCHTYISFPFSPAAAGSYQFKLYCDTMPDGVTELSETNNNLTFFHYYQPCNLDLTVQGCGSLDVKPTDPVSPGSITLYTSIGNFGQLPVTTPFIVNFDVEGTIYPVSVNSTLAPNTSYNVSVSVPTPPHGDNDLIVTVDGDNDVVELFETNNSQSAKLCWDFEVVNSKCSGGPAFRSTQYICNPIDLAVGVFNLGSYEASNLQVKFEVSGPGLAGWIDLGYATTFADNTCYCPHHVTLHSSFYFPGTGAYLVRITADFDGLYTECAEDNNQLILPVNVVENPDYAVYSQYIAPSDLNPDLNELITFNLSYKNEGCTGISSVELYMDVDNAAHDSMPAMALPTGTVNTYPMAESWSSSLPGLHVIRSVIDHDNGIAEGNELNNEATRAVLVGNAPNFNLFELVSSDLSPLSGESITLTASIVNEGESSADGVLQFYFVNGQGEEVLIDQFNIHLASEETIVQAVVWFVTHPYANIIARVINVDPLEYDFTDNEQELRLNSLTVNIETTHVACSSLDLGEMEAVITGGQPPYYVQWSNGQSGDSIFVPAGTYGVLVTDVNGLTAMAEDTVVDQALPTTWYLDADNDAFGDPDVSVYDCVQPEDYIGTGTDCDDTNANAYPGATELPDGEDNDCDGLVDEGLNSLSINAGDCETVYFGYGPSACQTLSVNVSGGTSPYTYQWSHGATTSTTSVCPDETTIYTIVVTDHNGFTAQDLVTVQVIDIRCGNNNDKVLVCHLPPGNPENVQMICISANAVPAHLEEHGDYLGICEATDPCDTEVESFNTTLIDELPIEEIHVMVASNRQDVPEMNSPFTVFPNPADSYVEIQFADPVAIQKVDLFDIYGKMVFSKQHQGSSLLVPTGEIENGIYFVRIQMPGLRMTKGLVILHR